MTSAPTVLRFFQAMNEREASDLYLTVGFPPSLRIEGTLEHIRPEPLTVDEINEIIASILTSRQRREFETQMELNTSLDVGRFGRFRVTAYVSVNSRLWFCAGLFPRSRHSLNCVCRRCWNVWRLRNGV